MYESTSYDTTKFSHSLFGDYSYARERDFQTFKTTEGLPYDCFYDVSGVVKDFFVEQTGNYVGNYVFAIMPNGTLFKYDHSEEPDFGKWIDDMYKQAYTN